jgi:hypothetical protein
MSTRESSFLSPDDPPSPKHKGATTKQFKLVWRHPGETKEVTETYEVDTDDPEKYCRELLVWFNSTLRPHERQRDFVRCEAVVEVPPSEHKWRKKTAMTQQRANSRPYDCMECERCGIMGKRYGLNSFVKIDSKYRLKVYKRCDTAMVAMGKFTPKQEIR